MLQKFLHENKSKLIFVLIHVFLSPVIHNWVQHITWCWYIEDFYSESENNVLSWKIATFATSYFGSV